MEGFSFDSTECGKCGLNDLMDVQPIYLKEKRTEMFFFNTLFIIRDHSVPSFIQEDN
jgi:hypothetical protein